MGSYSRYYFKLKGIKFNYTLTSRKEKASETEKLVKLPINVPSPQRDQFHKDTFKIKREKSKKLKITLSNWCYQVVIVFK